MTDPTDCSLLGFSLHRILQARILEWVAIPFSRAPSHPRDRAWVSCIAGRFFIVWATREAHMTQQSHYWAYTLQLHECMFNYSIMSDSLWSHRLEPTSLFCLWDFPGKNTGVSSHFFLQGIFLTQGLNLISCSSCNGKQVLYHWAIWEACIPWENHNSKSSMYSSVHWSTIYNSQDMEAT